MEWRGASHSVNFQIFVPEIYSKRSNGLGECLFCIIVKRDFLDSRGFLVLF